MPAKSGEIFGQLELADGTRSETVRLGSPSSGEPEPLFGFTPESPEAPKLVGALMSTYRLYDSGGLWSLYPIVGEEVEAVTWTIHEGGANPAETYFGFFLGRLGNLDQRRDARFDPLFGASHVPGFGVHLLR